MNESIVHSIASVIETAGIVCIVVGALLASILFIRRLIGPTEFVDSYRELRANLGRAILLGLEFLVAADIIGTVAIEPTFRTLGILGLIILIRTLVSFTLEAEIQGKWPWQRNRSENKMARQN